jgi:murein DD-endopeptidase MepM/ murein hydrolase activator NlpD
MAIQIRSFVETYRGIIAAIAMIFAFTASLSIAYNSSAVVFTEDPSEPSLGDQTALTGRRPLDINDAQRQAVLMADPRLTLMDEAEPVEEAIGNEEIEVATMETTLDRAIQKLKPRVEQQQLKVRSNDTLEKILERAGADRQQAYYATKSLAEVHNARSLNIGQAVNVTLEYPVVPSETDPTREVIADAPILKSLAIQTAVDEEVSVSLTDKGNYEPQRIVAELDKNTARMGGTINSSLYLAAIDAGIPDRVIVNLIGLYSYDIDFQREIREGDEFELLFERFYDDAGRPVKSGNIEYASMTVQGKQKGYYRFKTTDDGITDYYDAKGQSAKKFLMRTPINGARISSSFGRRKHPVLGYTKMHQGTDFAAPTGTPIFAAGNGVIERSSRYGSYGNYVRIRHANGYKTAYAHMSRYGKGVKQGRRVKQGQIIGYVGATGRVTGAHLHYEVMLSGKKVNPSRIKVPTGRKLGGNMLAAFRLERDRIEADRVAKPNWRPDQLLADADEPLTDG